MRRRAQSEPYDKGAHKVTQKVPEQSDWVRLQQPPSKRSRATGRRSNFKFAPGISSLSNRPCTEKTPEDEKLIADVLRANKRLQRAAPLRENHIQMLVAAAWKEVFREGRALMLEGDLNNTTFYIVADGSFRVTGQEQYEVVGSFLSRPEQPGRPVDRGLRTDTVMSRGHCVGDTSMLYDEPRLVTVTALETSEVWVICQADFKVIYMQAAAEAKGESSAVDRQKAAEDVELISESLRNNLNLQRLVPLHDEHIKQIAAGAWMKVLSAGQVLMYEGDLNAEAFYVVGAGSAEACGSEPFEIIQRGATSFFARGAHDGHAPAQRANSRMTKVVGKGHCFGEISMLHCAPRFATIKAVERCVLWVIDRASFQMVLMQGAQDNLRSRSRHLHGVDAARSLSKDVRERLAGLMDLVCFRSGEAVFCQGEIGAAFHVLHEGVATVVVDGKPTETLEADPLLGTHHCFGEDTLSSDSPYPSTLVVASPVAKVLRLSRSDFEEVWSEVIEDAPPLVFERLSTRSNLCKAGAQALDPSNFEVLALLGSSCLGPVQLVQHKGTKERYALKVFNKGAVVQRGLQQSVLRERGVWLMARSPFVVKVLSTFSSTDALGFVLEAALGGELSAIYEQENLYGNASHAQFYISRMVCALESLHRLRIVHRNVKPQNVLVTHLGHPKLSDFSLATVIIGQTFTACGTPDYLPPEVLAGTGHTRAVDWWSLGATLFELLAGRTPFAADHPMRVYWNIMCGVARVDFPAACRGPAEELVRALLRNQPVERLPMGCGGVQNVKDHAWFIGVDWCGLLSASVKPPWVPACGTGPRLSSFAGFVEDVLAPEPVAYQESQSGWDEGFDCA